MLTRAINWVRARMRRRYWYAVKVTRSQAWIVDTCAGGVTDIEFGRAQWWDTAELCAAELDDAEVDRSGLTLVRVNAQTDTNHFALKEIPWPTS